MKIMANINSIYKIMCEGFEVEFDNPSVKLVKLLENADLTSMHNMLKWLRDNIPNWRNQATSIKLYNSAGILIRNWK